MSTLLAVIGVALSISFLCSILESVLLSVTHSYIALLQERGDNAGKLLAQMRARIDEPIAAILTLNTIAHTVGAAMGGAIALEVFGDKWVALFSAVLTLVILVFSEILPKTVGATYWQLLAPPSARLLKVMILLMKPILVPLALFNRMISPQRTGHAAVSRAELEVLAEIGRREGTIDQEEWEVVSNVMNLDMVRVGQIMTRRTQVVAVPSDVTVDEAQRVMLDEGYLRLPVYEESIDHIIGILVARDLWRAAREGATDITGIIRAVNFVPESKPVEDLIREMRKQRTKMTIVLDEYGGTAGLVTFEDLLEEIVGDIQDEHEEEELAIEEASGGEVRLSGSLPVTEVNERYGLSLPEELYETVGGFVFGTLGRVGVPGDEVHVTGGVLRVLTVDGRRIERVAFVPTRPVGSTAVTS